MVACLLQLHPLIWWELERRRPASRVIGARVRCGEGKYRFWHLSRHGCGRFLFLLLTAQLLFLALLSGRFFALFLLMSVVGFGHSISNWMRWLRNCGVDLPIVTDPGEGGLWPVLRR
jgi:hypothetical protein